MRFFKSRWSWSALDIWPGLGHKKIENACVLGSIYHIKIDPTLFPISQGALPFSEKQLQPPSLKPGGNNRISTFKQEQLPRARAFLPRRSWRKANSHSRPGAGLHIFPTIRC